MDLLKGAQLARWLPREQQEGDTNIGQVVSCKGRRACRAVTRRAVEVVGGMGPRIYGSEKFHRHTDRPGQARIASVGQLVQGPRLLGVTKRSHCRILGSSLRRWANEVGGTRNSYSVILR
ncbi:hypothetical protein M406DRAFT_328488 [Cryphonectria parasitica EP155]|uniref:Uncharacterized protein n=1 Tax=Cryphonectria parasitica (strain ATCC 38755 / EP155) TaxID=660469 RepID=A0A9P4Y5Q1_CRYP1|nr:uncharacterized protein M406DRAFT_328488 [Cryphonectria parasitica EP155]KAF3767407.1 hypothetical protein M406DRAFT_328488 [Cryphonectria parasitica EP155]